MVINAQRNKCEEAEGRVFNETGVHVFSRLRGPWKGDEGKTYFEMNVGERNGKVRTGVWRESWGLFAQYVKE